MEAEGAAAHSAGTAAQGAGALGGHGADPAPVEELGVVAAFQHHGSEHLAGEGFRTIACGVRGDDTNLVIRLFQSFYAIETLGYFPEPGGNCRDRALLS